MKISDNANSSLNLVETKFYEASRPCAAMLAVSFANFKSRARRIFNSQLPPGYGSVVKHSILRHTASKKSYFNQENLALRFSFIAPASYEQMRQDQWSPKRYIYFYFMLGKYRRN